MIIIIIIIIIKTYYLNCGRDFLKNDLLKAVPLAISNFVIVYFTSTNSLLRVVFKRSYSTAKFFCLFPFIFCFLPFCAFFLLQNFYITTQLLIYFFAMVTKGKQM